MSKKAFTSRLKIVSLLLCCLSGAVRADGLPPLRISPDLLKSRPPQVPAARNPVTEPPAAATVVVDPVTVTPVIVEPVTVEKPAAVEARPAAPEPEAEPKAAPGDAKLTLPAEPSGSKGGDAPRSEPVESARPARGVPGPASAPDPVLAPAPAASGRRSSGATEVRALRILGLRTVEMVAEGQAELERDGMTLFGDRLTYNELTDEAIAEGNVRIEQGDDWVTGDWARLIVYQQVGELDRPSYFFSVPSKASAGEDGADSEPESAAVSGRGQADVMYFEGENQYRMVNATWTTCKPESLDWYIKAADLELDYDREVGTARGSSLVFKDVPILWWPRMQFPLAEQRQSGFLVPTLGVSNKTGVDVSIPYYWNIAPNYDATIAPRFMGRRGLQLAGEYRYLSDAYEGESRFEWLPRDRITGEARGLGAIQHRHALGRGFTASLNLNAVTDDDYFEDLSSLLAVASRRNLLREGVLSYTGSNWWRASLLMQGYQTLRNSEEIDIQSPYRRLPQLLLSAERSDLPGGVRLGMRGEYVNFRNPDVDLDDGKRLIAYPYLALPHVKAGYYITPKLGLHYSRYDLDEPFNPGGATSITRSVPIFSVDSGMFFDRETNVFGRTYEQTLEPRIYYVRIPYRDQDDIPVFDTSRYDFGFAQIFSENRYSGDDRIGDADQITVAVTSRLIDPATGIERLRATVGQRFHLSDRRVALPDEELSNFGRTDLLAALSGRVSRYVSIDSAFQYDPADGETERFNLAVRYQPDFRKVFNIRYRYSRDVLRDLDLSAQWPLGGRWYGVGRLTRSLKERRVTEAIAGVEYASECGCWALRTAMHRFAVTEDDVTNALFFQLQLTGLGGIGPSPENLLKRSVPGYGMINESISDRYFGQE